MAVTACQDRHETPGTHLGRARRPRIAAVPDHPAAPDRPGPIASAVAKVPKLLGFHIGR